jgi:hypothetical protein
VRVRRQDDPAERDRAEDRLVIPPAGTFDRDALTDLPEPVRRYLRFAIADRTPLEQSARVSMRGRIKLGRWLPFRATEVIAPHNGFVWRARVAGGLFAGSDRFVDGEGALDWRLAGLIPVMRASGEDVSRSAAARAGGEAQWLPTALVPQVGVAWSVLDDDVIVASLSVGGVPVEVRQRIDATGRPLSTVFDRWGDPDDTGTWGWHPFGGEMWAVRTFHGLTIPTAGRMGWHYGTERWPEGEFFRYEITDVRPVEG